MLCADMLEMSWDHTSSLTLPSSHFHWLSTEELCIKGSGVSKSYEYEKTLQHMAVYEDCATEKQKLPRKRSGQAGAGALWRGQCLNVLYSALTQVHCGYDQVHSAWFHESSPSSRLSVRAIFRGGATFSPSTGSCSRFFAAFFLSHCWWRYRNKMFVFSVTMICSEGYSRVGRYTEGRRFDALHTESAWNLLKLFLL